MKFIKGLAGGEEPLASLFLAPTKRAEALPFWEFLLRGALLWTGEVSIIPAMSEHSPRTINDYYCRVTLQRHYVGNPSESDERIEVVVRIPEQVAKTLAGGGKPQVVIFEIGSRVRNVATETVGVPNDSSSVIAVVSTVDAVLPPNLPTESNFTDQDGVEGWIL